MSKHLSPRHIRAIEKIGDCMIHETSGLPGFSALGCVKDVDRLLDYMPDQDLNDLKLLLGIFSLFPRFLLRWLLALLEQSAKPGSMIPLGAVLRLIRLGLRGIVMSLYYGHPTVLGKLDYQVGVYTGDMKKLPP